MILKAHKVNSRDYAPGLYRTSGLCGVNVNLFLIDLSGYQALTHWAAHGKTVRVDYDLKREQCEREKAALET